MYNALIAVPAHWRVYTSAKALLADWEAGKDFRHALTGQYFSARDKTILKETYTHIHFRYANMRRIVVVKL